jgi:formate/nitrite transporter FocA (FNT family)
MINKCLLSSTIYCNQGEREGGANMAGNLTFSLCLFLVLLFGLEFNTWDACESRRELKKLHLIVISQK